MGNLIFKYSQFLLCLCLLIGCKRSNSSDKTDKGLDFNQMVVTWNNAHSLKEVEGFSDLFDDSVLFYGTKQNKNSCIENKLSFLKKHPDFNQQIYGDIKIESINDSEVKCSFIKRVTVDQKTTDYPSYLVFVKRGKGWKIVTEGDLVTDSNLAKQKEMKVPKDAIKGDFNGDGVSEFAWLVKPKISEEEMGCIGDCVSYIKFSDSSIPSIKINDCIGGIPDNLGDLNGNGADEIGLLPEWFTSCWRSYYVWTLKNNQWIYAVDPISTHCNQWEEGVNPIEIDLKKKGNVLIRYSELTDDDIVTKTKSVPIK